MTNFIDVSDILDDDDMAVNFDLTITIGEYDNTGAYKEQQGETYQLVGVIEPVGNNASIRRTLAEGQRYEKMINVYVNNSIVIETLRIGDVMSKGDIITYNNTKYRAYMMSDYGEFGHTEIVAVIIDNQNTTTGGESKPQETGHYDQFNNWIVDT